MNTPWLTRERQTLNHALGADRLGHAPLMLGSPGVGKRSLAEWLARRLLCLEPVDGMPCGQCRACQLLDAGSHPDCFRLSPEDDKAEIVVDQVRNFIAALALTPSVSPRRAGLIVPADRLNRNAANALLKTLEEPPAGVWLILVADREDRLPATVISRCQRHHVPVPDRTVVLEWLRGRHAERDAAHCARALDLADGAPLMADRWLAGAELEQGLAIRDALDAILAGRDDGGMVSVWIEEWRQQPAETWAWLARYAQLWLRGALAAQPEAIAGLHQPSGTAAARQFARCWNQALRGIRLADRPVRHDWLMRGFLIEWRMLAAAESGTLA